MNREVDNRMDDREEYGEEEDWEDDPLPGPGSRSASYYHKPITFIRPVKQAAKKFAGVLQPRPGEIRLKYGILVSILHSGQ